LNREKDTDHAHKEGTSNSMVIMHPCPCYIFKVKKRFHANFSIEEQTPNKIRKGSAGVVPSMMLISSFQEMHAPYTQVLLYSLYPSSPSPPLMFHSFLGCTFF
jgi:Rab3 GTPase-activating protein catalytic subunit